MSTAKHRKSIRLKGYDYSNAGAYFVTVCAWNKICLFGDIASGEIQLNSFGKIIQICWEEINMHFPHIITDEYIIMPNHIHGILVIQDETVGANNYSPLLHGGKPRGTSKTIGSAIRGFKIGVTKLVKSNMTLENIWQRNYYEHVIRDDEELNVVREYILNNPKRWEMDRENPEAVSSPDLNTL